MNILFIAIAVGTVVVATIILFGVSAGAPTRTVLPLYAASLPVASVVTLSVPSPPPFNTLSSLLGAAAIAAIIVHAILLGRARTPSLPVATWMLFLAWVSSTALWAMDGPKAVKTITIATPLVVLMVLTAIVPLDEIDLDALRLGVIISGMVVGAYGMFLLGTGSPLSAGTRFSLSAVQGETDPNILAATLLLPLALSLERAVFGGSRWWSPRIWRALGVAGTVLSLLAFLITGSRGGLMSAAVTFAFTLYFCARIPEGRERARRLVVRTGVVVAALALTLSIAEFFGGPGTARRLVSRPPVGRLFDTEDRGSGRLDIWNTGVILCRDACGFGVGLGNFPVAYNQTFAFTPGFDNPGLNRPAHNIYLGLAVETGFLGLTLLGIALVAEWRAVSRADVHRVAPGLKGAFIGLLLVEVFLSAIWFKYFWLLFILIRVAEGAVGRPPESMPNLQLAPREFDRPGATV